ncbi:unnamed protein product, partial [Arabidopsis halleri]
MSHKTNAKFVDWLQEFFTRDIHIYSCIQGYFYLNIHEYLERWFMGVLISIVYDYLKGKAIGMVNCDLSAMSCSSFESISSCFVVVEEMYNCLINFCLFCCIQSITTSILGPTEMTNWLIQKMLCIRSFRFRCWKLWMQMRYHLDTN